MIAVTSKWSQWSMTVKLRVHNTMYEKYISTNSSDRNDHDLISLTI